MIHASKALVDMTAEATRVHHRLLILLDRGVAVEDPEKIGKLQTDAEAMMLKCRRFLTETQRWGED